MSTITKTIAEDVSVKLMEKQNKKLVEYKNEIQELITQEYEKTIPENALAFFKSNPEFCKSTSSLTLIKNGFNYERVILSRKLPCKADGYFTPEDKAISKIRKWIDSISDKQKEYEKLKQEVYNAILSLKTYNRVKDNFPEAYEFLPEKINTSLAINISDIQSKLK